MSDGIAVLDGPIGEAERGVARALARSVPGVVDIRFAVDRSA